MSAASERPVLDTLMHSFSSQRCPNGKGAIEIVSRSSRIAARIYVENKIVYAIEVSNFPLEIIRRIITSEHITDADRDHLLEVFTDNLADPKIVDYVLENQMIPVSVVVTYLKDLFLGACDYIAAVPKAEIGWRENVEPKTARIPDVELDVLWKVIQRRKEDYERMASLFTVDASKVRDLNFKRIENVDTEITQLTANIYSLASGEWSILDFARQFGISLYLSTREIQQLWLNKNMKIVYDGEFTLKPPTDETTLSEEISYEDATSNYQQSLKKTPTPDRINKSEEEIPIETNNAASEIKPVRPEQKIEKTVNKENEEIISLKEKFNQIKLLADEALSQLEELQSGKNNE